MNPTTRIVGCVGLALLTSGIAHAQNWADNLYLHGDIGPAFFQSAPVVSRTFTSFSDSFGSVHRGHTYFDTEIRADLSLGCNLTKSFAIEAEAGFIWDPNDNRNNYFYQIPVMLNGIYQIPLGHSWNAYLGAGAGAVIGKTHSLFPQAFHTPFVFDDTDWSAGYQAEAGIKYALSRHVDIDLGYKFLGIAQYDFQFRRVDVSQKVTIDDLFIHSVQASLTLKF
jgi:opacity protein-like surface antigen